MKKYSEMTKEELEKELVEEKKAFARFCLVSIGCTVSIGLLGLLGWRSALHWKSKLNDHLNIPFDFPRSRVRCVKRSEERSIDAPKYAMQIFYCKPNPSNESDYKFMGEWGTDTIEDFLDIQKTIDDFVSHVKED